jgi:AraC-like DNA-binding protein
MQNMLDTGSYFGRVVSKRNLSRVILSETTYYPYVRLPLHYHKNFYICYVLKGAYSETYSKTKINCLQGDIIIHPQHLEHSNVFDDKGGTCFNIELADGLQKEIHELKMDRFKMFDSRYAQLRTTVHKMYKEFKSYDEFSSTIIEGLLLETIGYSARETHSHLSPYWLKKAQEIIQDSKYSMISLSFIAGQLKISPAHLAREFKKATGTTIGEYIQNIKIQQACERLKKNASILDVVIEFGYSDQSHITRSFKKLMGVTPKRYQSLNKS